MGRTGGGHPAVQHTEDRGAEPNHTSSILLFSEVIVPRASSGSVTCCTPSLRKQDLKANGQTHFIFQLVWDNLQQNWCSRDLCM